MEKGTGSRAWTCRILGISMSATARVLGTGSRLAMSMPGTLVHARCSL